MAFIKSKKPVGLPRVPSATQHTITQTALLWILLTSVAVIVFQFFQGGFLTSLFALAIVAAKAILMTYQKKTNGFILLLLFGLGTALVYYQFGKVSGHIAGFKWLSILLALKILESKSVRDYAFAYLLMLFMAAGTFLYQSSPVFIALVCLYVTAVLAGTLHLSAPEKIPNRDALKLSAGLCLRALPLAIILFFLFPRINASIGFLPGESGAPGSLSDSLKPGDFAGRAFNDALAFRATFTGQQPAANSLYWRVRVLTDEKNFGWNTNKDNTLTDTINTEGNSVSYEILHEPSQDKYLPTLDKPIEVSTGQLYSDLSARMTENIGARRSYTGTSIPSPLLNDQAPSPDDYLQTSREPSEQTQLLLQQWQAQATSTEELISLMLNHFRQQPFHYSLEPPPLNATPVEDFLFNTRTGYCEYYSSTLATLMRWSGIPSRVVIGYQGGEWNEAGQFVKVTYAEAHAWNEVWLEERGAWIRVDPTAAVAPERIDHGMDAIRSLWEDNRLGDAFSGSQLANYLRPNGVQALFNNVSQTWQSVEYKWSRWVLNYNSDTQKELLKKLRLSKFSNWQGLIILMIVFSSILLGFYFIRSIPRKKRLHPISKLYDKFLKKLSTQGIHKHEYEGALDFANRAAKFAPEQETQIREITALYIEHQYSSTTPLIDKTKHAI